MAGLPPLAFIPKMVVGTLLFLFAFGFIVEWLVMAWRRMDVTDYVLIVLIVGIIVLFGFLEGIGVGILIAALIFLVKYSRLNVVKAELSGREYRSNVERPYHANEILAERGDRLIVFELQGYIFFGSAISLLDRIRQRIEQDRRTFFVYKLLREQTEDQDQLGYAGVLSHWGGVHYIYVQRVAAIVIILFLLSYAGAQMIAGSKALHAIFGWPIVTGAFMSAVIIALYCFAGGLRASIWTDAAQSFVMVLAMALMAWIGLGEQECPRRIHWY